MKFWVSLILSYLLGSIPSAYIIVRMFRNKDIRIMGSGNVGTMNVRNIMGWKAALVVLLCDALKGIGAVYICFLLSTDPKLGLALSVTGHICPPWLKFHGGKGLATALGGTLALGQWQIIMVFILVWLSSYMFIWNKKVDYANLTGALGVLIYEAAADGSFGIILMAALIFIKHFQVIKKWGFN